MVVETDVRQRQEAVDRWIRRLPDALEAVNHELARRHHVLVFADADGVILHRTGQGWIADQADAAYIIPGSIWHEDRKGTNAIGTTLVERRPVAVHAAAHFASCYHDFTCYAAPVFDLRGDLLGVLDATTVADRRESLGWLAVVAATQQLDRLVRRTMDEPGRLLPLSSIERLLNRFSGPAVLVGARGNVRVASAQTGQGQLRDLRSVWPRIQQAVTAGESSLPAEAGGTLQLEPFTDLDGQLLEVAVFWETDRPRTSVTVARRDPFAAFESPDPTLQDVCRRARTLAPTDLPLTLVSETGTGKEVLANAIHSASKRALGPFVPLNCGAIAPGVMESELFGYAPGAFTGAASGGREGWLAQAHGGTLFLDEVADMPPSLQSALLRFLDRGTYHRVGEQRMRHADVRVVAATSRDLAGLVDAGVFRPDLYYRIGAALLRLPPLRQRSDLAAFAQQLLDQVCVEAHVPVAVLADESLEAIETYRWPGNVRQLRYALMHAVAMCGSEGVVQVEHLPESIALASSADSVVASSPTREEATRQALLRALRASQGNITAAARTLGVARSTVYRMMERFGVARPTPVDTRRDT
ncbi:MAG: sigma 54-interacting transcriptional regulator [Myxococcota bacterium]